LTGQIKANFDAAVRKGVDTGIAVIFRDHEGETLAAATKFHQSGRSSGLKMLY